ncbi:hypothetical protein [Nocardioides sp. TF02-7]|uniref:hypothetical protein n=1 Tax=Nocardioides sp. TF02-7 TaxID=2917724 RepID=UPI001F06037C|nr:hypothetical protein [Nocardioides sp. TF02-7]UMG94571.1 hypothetical protein MF408_11815 [Nocardioides sp. TF02-7]
MSRSQAPPRLRLLVGRLLAGRDDDAGGTVTVLDPAVTVPLTVRETTADQKDVRLLLEVVVRPVGASAAHDVEPLVCGVVPLVSRWVRRHRLADLTPDLHHVWHDPVAELLESLGADLLSLRVVAIEHLILSPSGYAHHRDADGPR